jgi:hypothetical protein
LQAFRERHKALAAKHDMSVLPARKGKPEMIEPMRQRRANLEAAVGRGAGSGRIFIWGWGEYNDVFKGTTLHRTEFCIELTVLNLGTTETKPQIAVIYFPLYGLFNSPS